MPEENFDLTFSIMIPIPISFAMTRDSWLGGRGRRGWGRFSSVRRGTKNVDDCQVEKIEEEFN